MAIGIDVSAGSWRICEGQSFCYFARATCIGPYQAAANAGAYVESDACALKHKTMLVPGSKPLDAEWHSIA